VADRGLHDRIKLWPRRPILFSHLLALLGYLALTCLFTYPLLLEFAHRLIGRGDLRDLWQSYWNLWWVKTALLNLKTNPFHTPYLYHPWGASLYFHTLNILNGFLALPLQLLLGHTVAYNLLVVVSFALGGYCTFLLASDHMEEKSAAFVAGMIFTFSPFHLWHANGRMQLVAIQWLPLYILFLLRTLERRSARSALLASLSLLLTSLTDWYYLLYLFLFTALAVAYHFWKEGNGQAIKETLMLMALIVALFLFLDSPILLPMLREASGQDYMFAPFGHTVSYSADLLSFFIPSSSHFLWGGKVQAWRAAFLGGWNENFMGYTVLFLAALSLIAPLRKRTGLWLISSLLFFLLALGPFLHLDGRKVSAIPLPYALLYRFLPFLAISRYPARMSVMVFLSLSMMAGQGLSWFMSKASTFVTASRRASITLTLFAGGLVVLEFLTVPFPMAELPSTPPFYHTLAAAPLDQGVLDIPIDREGGLRPALYLFYQTGHQRPIFSGYLARTPPYLLADIPAFQRYMVFSEPSQMGEPGSRGEDLETFRRFGFRYLILHKDLMPRDEERRAKILRALQAAFGDAPPIYEDKRVAIYEVEGPSPP
jgi:hypothetical protein